MKVCKEPRTSGGAIDSLALNRWLGSPVVSLLPMFAGCLTGSQASGVVLRRWRADPCMSARPDRVSPQVLLLLALKPLLHALLHPATFDALREAIDYPRKTSVLAVLFDPQLGFRPVFHEDCKLCQNP